MCQKFLVFTELPKNYNIKLEVKSNTPKLYIEGKYKAEVMINNAKMNSKVAFNLTMSKFW